MFTKYFRFLNKFDVFGHDISLNIKGNNIFKTPFGGLTTIGIFCIVFLIFFSRISIYLGKKEVNVTKIRNIDPDPNLMVLSKNNFMFALSIE